MNQTSHLAQQYFQEVMSLQLIQIALLFNFFYLTLEQSKYLIFDL